MTDVFGTDPTDRQPTEDAQVSSEESQAPQSLNEEGLGQVDQAPAGEEGEVTGSAPLQETAAAGDDQSDRVTELENTVAERTQDLQRLQAEYVNYKRRVDRDRNLARQAGIESVVADLLPVLDSIDLARQHKDNSQGFELVADSLTKVAQKHGLSSFGAVGDAFDPVMHDALMQAPMADGQPVTETTVSQVIQTGYKLGDRVLRPARVGVANPE